MAADIVLSVKAGAYTWSFAAPKIPYLRVVELQIAPTCMAFKLHQKAGALIVIRNLRPEANALYLRSWLDC